MFPRGPVTVPLTLQTPLAHEPSPFRVHVAPPGAVTVTLRSHPLSVLVSVVLRSHTPPLGPVVVLEEEQTPPAQEPLAW